MPINPGQIQEAVKRAGPRNVRIVPMPDCTNKQQIEIMENGNWRVIADGLSYRMANDIIQQATNRLICG